MDTGRVSINAETGEIAFEIKGRKVLLKATWKAISDIQQQLGYGMVPLARRLASREFGLTELTTILYHGVLAANPPVRPTFDDVAKLVFEGGLLAEDTIKAVTKFCELALTGGRPAGEDAAAEARTNTSPSAAV